jgi:hypothetical protein
VCPHPLQERAQLFDAVHTIPTVQKKAEWAMRWITSSESFLERLVAFACVEGIHFSGRQEPCVLRRASRSVTAAAAERVARLQRVSSCLAGR